MTRVGLGVKEGHSTVVTLKQEDLSAGSIPSIVYIENHALMLPPGKTEGSNVSSGSWGYG